MSDDSQHSKLHDPLVTDKAAMTDFFSPDVVKLVLHNPTTAYRLKTFCQSTACAENMEFLEKIGQYSRLLAQASELLSEIQSTYLSPNSPDQLNAPESLVKSSTSDISSTIQTTLPALGNILDPMRLHIEELIEGDIYPKFVMRQIMISTKAALANGHTQYAGLGDCFCLTLPTKPDNPIVFASDGFVDVTGYSRGDIVNRNCRFLQGSSTDRKVVRRLGSSIKNNDTTIELLLNYKKNGDPFWNLLHVTPLFDEYGNLSFFLGGQINCSSTLHSNSDVLDVLNCKEDDSSDPGSPLSTRSQPSWDSKFSHDKGRPKILQAWRSHRKSDASDRSDILPTPGLEKDLISRLSKISFEDQVQAFQVAYSKFAVLEWSQHNGSMTIAHYSLGISDVLCPPLPNDDYAPIYHWDVFKAIAERSPPRTSTALKSFKSAVHERIARGKAVSIELNLLDGVRSTRLMPREKSYVTHWTPCKDVDGRAKYVVLVIAPK